MSWHKNTCGENEKPEVCLQSCSVWESLNQDLQHDCFSRASLLGSWMLGVPELMVLLLFILLGYSSHF